MEHGQIRWFLVIPVVLWLARWLASEPAALAGLRQKKGRLAPGLDADLVIFHPDQQWQVDQLFHRHPESPYRGRRLLGRVSHTYLRGNCIFAEGSHPGSPAGVTILRRKNAHTPS